MKHFCSEITEQQQKSFRKVFKNILPFSEVKLFQTYRKDIYLIG
jgi:hypothetical protein